MGLTLRQIRENTAAARGLMQRARAEKFAVGAFSFDNQETLKAVCRAAMVKKAPVIVEVGASEVDSMGLENIRDMVDNYKEELGIEIYVSLVHSPTVEAAIAAIETGFEFVQLDIAGANEEELTAKTKLIVDYSKLTGALSEAEPDYFEGAFAASARKFDYEEAKNHFTDPEDAKRFADATGIDVYVASVGNLHGNHSVPKILDTALLKRIRGAVECNIILHGGYGIPDHYFKEAVKAGVNKISVSSEMRLSFRSSLEKVLKQNPDELEAAKFMDEVIGAIQHVVEDKIDLFGASGKARPQA